MRVGVRLQARYTSDTEERPMRCSRHVMRGSPGLWVHELHMGAPDDQIVDAARGQGRGEGRGVLEQPH